MVDVFISYSRTNRDMVARLAEAVKAEGYGIWWDAELPPHLSYGDVITEKISAAKAAIVVWSESAAASEWVRAEADVARNQKKLIQVSVDDRMPPLPFNQIQFASIGDWRGEPDHPGWRKVKASLAILCGAPGEDSVPEAPRPRERSLPPPPAEPAPPPGRSRGLSAAVVGLLALLVLVAGAAVYLSWTRGTGTGDVVRADPVAPAAAAAEPAPAEESRALPAAAEPPGAELAVAAEPAADPAQIIPDSSVRRLTGADVAGLSAAELRIARNEIFARNGRIFRDPALRRHFEGFSWYVPRSAEVALSPIERANVQVLQDAEAGKF